MSVRRHPNRNETVDAGDWNADVIKRRAFRHTMNGPEVPKGSRSKKNTKKWCKGKVGVEHTPVGKWGAGWHNYMCILACTRCGKHLDYWYSRSFFGVKVRPDWVPPSYVLLPEGTDDPPTTARGPAPGGR